MTRRITVGDAAAAVGVSARAIRHWEAMGLIAKAGRTPGGYRTFAEEDLAVLRFIHQAKTLGLTLGEIRSVLDLKHAGNAPCDRVAQMLDERIAEIDRALSDLAHLRSTLVAARMRADGPGCGDRNAGAICRIIEEPGQPTG